MTTINDVNFYDKNDVIHSRGGFVVLDDKLDPAGIYLPAVKGFEDSLSDELDGADERIVKLCDSFKTMMGE